MYRLKAAEWGPQHFKWEVKDRVATVTLNRPERKNPLTFESYAELLDTFRAPLVWKRAA
jgi:enoyl-CoA hydratase/carnithine racemase